MGNIVSVAVNQLTAKTDQMLLLASLKVENTLINYNIYAHALIEYMFNNIVSSYKFQPIVFERNNLITL